jgi:hypothetical protein
MHPILSTVLAGVLLASTGPAPAQTAFSLEVGALSAYEDATVQVGFRLTPARAGKTGIGVAFATFPDALAEGALIGLLDVDVAHGVSVREEKVLVLPRFGASVIGGIGDGAAAAAVGFNIGAGVLALTSPRLGVRLDYTYRRVPWDVAFSSVSLGIAWVR